MPEINKPTLLRHIAASDLTAVEKRYLEGLVNTSEPGKHGRWLSYTGTHWTRKEDEYGDPEYKEHIFYVCSECRRKTVVQEKYCPNCGTKMDGGVGNG